MKRVLFILSVVANAVACESENKLATIDVAPVIDAYVGNSIVLEVSHSPAAAIVPACHFKTDNSFVAEVSEQGRMICKHVGVCTIHVATADARFSTTCTVNVKPNHELFRQPALDFNASKTAIKLKEAGKTMVYETATMMVYQASETPAQQVIYQFDENQKLIASTVRLPADASSELATSLDEYYERYPFAERADLLVWRGIDTEVVVRIANDGCFVVYNHFSGSSTCSQAVRTIETIRAISK